MAKIQMLAAAGSQFRIVGGEDQSAAMAGLQFEKLPDHGLCRVPVQAACGFVSKNQAGFMANTMASAARWRCPPDT